jgi:DUF971 family protein
MLQLAKVKKEGNDQLVFTWSDGITTQITLKGLRDACPCAECQGETVLFESAPPQKPEVITPEMATLQRVEVVGNYSLQPYWADGHHSGLYTWEYLRGVTSQGDSHSCGGGSCNCEHDQHEK